MPSSTVPRSQPTTAKTRTPTTRRHAQSIDYADEPAAPPPSKKPPASSSAARKKRVCEDTPEPDEHTPPPPPTKKARSSSEVPRDSSSPTPETPSRSSSPVQTDGMSLDEWLELIHTLDGKASKTTRIKNNYEAIYHTCRNMVRKMGHFARFERVIRTGIKYIDTPLAEQPWAQSTKYDTAMEDRTMWEVLMSDFPGFATHIKHLHGDHEGVKLLSRFLTTTLSKTRSDDILRMENNDNFLRTCKIPNSKYKLSKKSHRGYKNTTMARRLIPPQWIPQFDADPQTMTRKLKDGETAPLPGDLPSCLWDLDQFTEQDTMAGLLYGSDVRGAYKLLYTGPESAIENYNKSGKGQPSIAQKYGITTVTIHSIVYVALLVRHFWSTQGVWKATDGKFSYPRMARLLLSACMRNPKYMHNLINDYTHDVFGNISAYLDVDPEDDPNSTFGLLMLGPNELDDSAGAFYQYFYGESEESDAVQAPGDAEPEMAEEGDFESADDADAHPDEAESNAISNGDAKANAHD
ncbi:hypothetical protein C8Q80DRAFT_1117760 [Daedaleopsis nitida]|nr:hypothetical protein C8Q80DRAFT_1117760 [Daedaleopsis nitida]